LLLRILFLLVLLYLILVLLRLFLSWRNQRPNVRGREFAELDDMVQDPHCLSYVPKAEAVAREGRYFCSEQCAAAFAAIKPAASEKP
jgi:hypothetical protein